MEGKEYANFVIYIKRLKKGSGIKNKRKDKI